VSKPEPEEAKTQHDELEEQTDTEMQNALLPPMIRTITT